MSKKKFLTPVAVLAAALAGNIAIASPIADPVYTTMPSVVQEQPQDFIIKPSDSGVTLAAHSSHRSHSSHSSHRSHSSHYSGR